MYFLASPFVLFYAYILLGSDIRSLGDGLRARQNLRRQLDIAATNPRDADAHYQLGLIYQERHQYDEAKQRFSRAMEIDGTDADPVFQLGRIALEEDRFEDAIELLSRAAALDDRCCSHEVWRDLGVAYFRSGRLEEARLALGKYVERRAYDPEGLYWYGKVLLALGQRNEARQQFEQCREAVETMQPNRRRQLAKWKTLAAAGTSMNVRVAREFASIRRRKFSVVAAQTPFIRFAAQLGQLARRVNHQRRLVALAPLRHGSEIRRIGFNQDAIARRRLRGFLNCQRLGKRHDAAEAQIKAQIERAGHFFKAA